MQNAHRMRVIEGESNGAAGGAAGAGISVGLEKDKELRQPSGCTSTGSTGAAITALVDQFVTSIANRKRPVDERQVKLAHRLQANVGGFSPDKVRGLRRRKQWVEEQEQECVGGEQQHYQLKTRGDTSLQLLREAIEVGTSRLRSTRNGTNFLQNLVPSDVRGLHELHDQYLRARTKTSQQLISGGGGGSSRTSPRIFIGFKTTNNDTTSSHTAPFSRDEDASPGCIDSEDRQGTWYLPYTTRHLQLSPHRRLPSLEEFRARTRDEKQPLRPFRATSNFKSSSLPSRMRASAARFNHTSQTLARSSLPPTAGTLNAVEEDNDIALDAHVVASSKGISSPFSRAASSPSPVPVPPLHSIEKLQAAVDALETTKSQQSARLATFLEMLEHDRRECLAGKFRSLSVRCDAVEDLRRMRERSERQRGQRVLSVVAKTADWYPELLRRLLAREGVNNSTTGTSIANTGGLMPLHAAELFIVQAVRRLTNGGCEFQTTQLCHIILLLDPDDLVVPQVQQLLDFLRTALHISNDVWIQFFDAHNLPAPTGDIADDRKDAQTLADGKSSFTAAATTR
ncbi:unnamed protein product [Phytophthora lilii]|uniref:Unnamed protein product n=1 Tax=Phytophthora lilii TaxID=2077276 RepID=A0A9W6TU74_9STRA|nr:unnamed protein product [Phytophthora lilii]